jgi:phenylacetate-CoA ligase
MSAMLALARRAAPVHRPARDPRPQRTLSPAALRRGAGAAALGAACGAFSAATGAVRARFPLWRALARTYSPALDPLAAANALFACQWARATTPAYAHFLGAGRFQRLASFRPMTKANYVRAYDHQARCRGGRIARVGAMVDESSGSTGAPFNWLRSGRELADIHAVLANYIRLEIPSDNLLCINAFSMGAWATGVNFTMAMRQTGIVKSIGPDIAAIIATLQTFGPGFDYLITAYPSSMASTPTRRTPAASPASRSRRRRTQACASRRSCMSSSPRP